MSLLVVIVLAMAIVSSALPTPNIGGAWTSYRANSQNSKYVPIRLGYFTGAQYQAPSYGFGYGPQHIVALSDGTAFVPTYGKLTRWNVSSPSNATAIASVSFSGDAEMHTSILHPLSIDDQPSIKSNSPSPRSSGRSRTGLFVTLIGDATSSGTSRLYAIDATVEQNLTVKWSRPLTGSSVFTAASSTILFWTQCLRSTESNITTCNVTLTSIHSGVDIYTKTLLRAADPTGKGVGLQSIAVSDDGAILFWDGFHNASSAVGALSVALGTSIWSQSCLTSWAAVLVYNRNHNCVVRSTVNALSVFDATSGHLRWTVDFASNDAYMSPAIDDDAIYAPMNYSIVRRLSLKDGSSLKAYGVGYYANDVIVFKDAVVVQQSQAGAVKLQVYGKESGALLIDLPTPAGYFNKKLGFACGWLWDWSGASGAAPMMFRFY